MGSEAEDEEDYLQYDEAKGVYSGVIADDSFITVEKIYSEEKVAGQPKRVFSGAYVYLRLPVYDIEGIRRGLRQQFLMKLTS